MIKQFTTGFALMISVIAFSQVGIQTENPQATLDVAGAPTDATKLDGIIAPRITGAQLRAKTYTTDQTGALVYVTTADTAPAGQTIDVTAAGYYYFDGTKWVANSGGSGSFIEVDGVIGNEVLTATTNGGLVRAGSGTAALPYTLGLPLTATTGQTMTYNGTSWLPANPVNLYNANGTLTSARTVTRNNASLTFQGLNTGHFIRFSSNTGLEDFNLTAPSRGISRVNGGGASFIVMVDDNNLTQIETSGNSTGMLLGTENASPLRLESNGVERMRISETTGSVGIGTSSPNTRVRLHVAKLGSDITPVMITGCPVHENNAEAVTGGLPVGGLYRKADGTLMVRY